MEKAKAWATLILVLAPLYGGLYYLGSRFNATELNNSYCK